MTLADQVSVICFFETPRCRQVYRSFTVCSDPSSLVGGHVKEAAL
jgi:hypothetical protein